MENRLYPNWEELEEQHNPLTEGEKTLLHFLDDNLPRDNHWTKDKSLVEYQGWLIFAQPFLNGTRPDIIIFNPFVGIVIYEVKDWKLINYEHIEGKGIFVSDGKGRYPIKNPIDQVEHYREKLIGQLVPKIGEAIDQNKKNFGLIKVALYFHNASTKEAQDLFGYKVKDFKYFPILGKDNLSVSKLSEIVPDVRITKSNFWVKTWNEDIIFWLKPPFHSIEQGKPLKLKSGQIQIATPQSGHYRVKGVAGSGKTQALAYRAAALASKGYKVLVISFNITLWHFVKDMIARAPFAYKWDSFVFTHFHGFCKDILNEFQHKWPVSPQREQFADREEFEEALGYFFKVTVPNAVITAIAGQSVFKYDAILIDEGQDYHIEWYEMLTNHFLNSRDEVLIVCDKKQNIYERELEWLDKRSSNKHLLEKFEKDFVRLTETYRLPAKVVKMTNDFSETYGLDQELKVSKISQETELFVSEHIVWLNINEDEWEFYIWNSFLRLKKEGQSASDMVFLLPSHETGEIAVALFKKNNIEVNHIFNENGKDSKYHKKSFWMGDSRIKISTIHSFKGWELSNIVLLISEKVIEGEKQLDAIVYTALTRTRQNLIILNCNDRYSEFGSKFPKKWHE